MHLYKNIFSARTHFKERLARELPATKPFKCPVDGCQVSGVLLSGAEKSGLVLKCCVGQEKQYPDWQAVMRHYIGNKHGLLERYVMEHLKSSQATSSPPASAPAAGVRV